MSLLPTTVLSGFLGAGKTTLLQNILNNREGLRIAVIVNDMSEVNIDARLVNGAESTLSRTEERLVELSNGCICCTLREDLLIEIRKLAEEKRFDYLLIESTGVSEPLPIAETFTFADEEGRSLSDVAYLDTMVTVVDAYNFLLDYKDSDSLCDRQLALGEDDDRNITDLLIDQVEFANVIVVNKIDLVGEKDLLFLESLLHRLNPSALLVRAQRGRLPLQKILRTGLFDFEKAALSPGWLQDIRGQHPAETATYGISSFVYRSSDPFDPEPLYRFLDTAWESGIIRAKGFVWLASRPTHAAILSLASRSCSLEPGGTWAEEGTMPGQELVLIGFDLDQTAIEEQLRRCTVSSLQATGRQGWYDRFPAWNRLH